MPSDCVAMILFVAVSTITILSPDWCAEVGAAYDTTSGSPLRREVVLSESVYCEALGICTETFPEVPKIGYFEMLALYLNTYVPGLCVVNVLLPVRRSPTRCIAMMELVSSFTMRMLSLARNEVVATVYETVIFSPIDTEAGEAVRDTSAAWAGRLKPNKNTKRIPIK